MNLGSLRSVTLALAALSAGASAGDTDDSPRYARLRLGPAAIGGSATVELRGAASNGMFVLMLDGATTVIDADGPGPFPFFRVFGGAALLLPTDASGSFSATAAVPNDASLQGATVLGQALTSTPGAGFETTNVAATTITPGAAGPTFVDASFVTPLVGKLNSSGDGAARDLDGDGDPDLALITGPNFSVHVFRNDGFFNFVDVTPVAIPLASQTEAADVELFDANGDGRVDIFVVGGAGDPNDPPLPNQLLLNQGGLVFARVPLPAVPGLARDLAIFDADQDGDLDVVLANGVDGVHQTESAAPNTLLVNQGFAQNGTEGTFVVDPAFENALWNGPDYNICVTHGDIDGDGDFDLFFGRSDTQLLDGFPGQPNVLLRNDGNLAFVDVSSNFSPHFSDNTQGARFGDFNGDGALDLIVANSTVSVSSAASGELYFNQGDGTFVEDAVNYPQVDESELALRLQAHVIDVDLDGDLDIVQQLHEFIDFDGSSGNPSGTGGDDQVLVNQGGAQGGVEGVFVMDGAFSVGIFITADHVIADFDLDGDDDIYVSNNGGFFAPFPLDDRFLENTRIP